LLLAHLAVAKEPASDPEDQPPAPASEREVSWKTIVPNILSDQKRIWLFPAKLGQGKNWIPTAAVLGMTAGLVGADPPIASYFRRTTSYHRFNQVFTSNATAIGTFAVPASLYIAGQVRKDSRMKATALLAGEAVANAEIVTSVLKGATRRVRPADVPLHGNFSDTWWDSKGAFHGGFTSGHAIAAFSVATVISRRYGKHRWVPYVAYGLAGAVSISRMTLSAHFASDVFMGGALGYSIGRFAVLRE